MDHIKQHDRLSQAIKRVEIAKSEERIRVELVISGRALDEAAQIGREWIAIEILEEVKRIKEMKEKMLDIPAQLEHIHVQEM